MNFYEKKMLYTYAQTSFYRHSKAFFKIPFNNSAKIFLNSPHKQQTKCTEIGTSWTAAKIQKENYKTFVRFCLTDSYVVLCFVIFFFAFFQSILLHWILLEAIDKLLSYTF